MFKISEFSRLCNVSIRTLRYYDEIGLFKPYFIEEQTNYRYYSASQIEIINKICSLKEMGFSLEDIKNMINNRDDIMLTKKYFETRKEEIQKEINNIIYKAKIIEKASQLLNKETNEYKDYNVIQKLIPERKVISLTSTVENYNKEGVLWELLFCEIKKQKVKIAKEAFCMAIYLDDEYKEKDVNIEVQISILGDYKSTDEIKIKNEKQLNVASVTFNGDYSQMPKVSQSLALWIESMNYVICGPMINIFHVSPAKDKNPDNYITESCYVIRKRE